MVIHDGISPVNNTKHKFGNSNTIDLDHQYRHGYGESLQQQSSELLSFFVGYFFGFCKFSAEPIFDHRCWQTDICVKSHFFAN